MSRLRLMEQQLLRWMVFVGGDRHTASRLATALGFGVDGVRKTLVRLRQRGLVRVTGYTGPERTTTTWAAVGSPDIEEIIVTDEYDVLTGTHFNWHIDTMHQDSATRELARLVEVMKLRAEERRRVAWPIGHQPLHVIIYNCEQWAGLPQDERRSVLLTEVARLVEVSDTRVQLRSYEMPSAATIPGPLYFLSILDDNLVTFLHEPKAA